jgi:hypothetical protein
MDKQSEGCDPQRRRGCTWYTMDKHSEGCGQSELALQLGVHALLPALRLHRVVVTCCI